MKVLALILACVLASAQGRSAKVATTAVGRVAALGENPWVVHLRLAIATSGFLNSCAGSLFHGSWVLTSAECVKDARFIWIRYGVVNVVNPELVTETTTVRTHPTDDLALLSINRFVQQTDNIGHLRLESSSADVPSEGRICVWGADENDVPGEILRCFDLKLSYENGHLISNSADGSFTRHDTGSALVTDGVQTGILVGWQSGEAEFLRVVSYVPWIRQQTGLDLNS